jgi:DNA replication protein DnaC
MSPADFGLVAIAMSVIVILEAVMELPLSIALVTVLYQRVPRLFSDLALMRGDGRHPRLQRALGRVDLLILVNCPELSSSSR